MSSFLLCVLVLFVRSPPSPHSSQGVSTARDVGLVSGAKAETVDVSMLWMCWDQVQLPCMEAKSFNPFLHQCGIKAV